MEKHDLLMAHSRVAPQAPGNAAPCSQRAPVPCRAISAELGWGPPSLVGSGVSILGRSSRARSFNMQEPVTVLNPSDVCTDLAPLI